MSCSPAPVFHRLPNVSPHRFDPGPHPSADVASLSLIHNKPRPYCLLDGHHPGNRKERSTLHSTFPCCLCLLNRNL